MKKIRLLIELEYDDGVMHDDTDEGRQSFACDILGAAPTDPEARLTLWSAYIGDEVGVVSVIGSRSMKQGENYEVTESAITAISHEA